VVVIQNLFLTDNDAYNGTPSLTFVKDTTTLVLIGDTGEVTEPYYAGITGFHQVDHPTNANLYNFTNGLFDPSNGYFEATTDPNIVFIPSGWPNATSFSLYPSISVAGPGNNAQLIFKNNEPKPQNPHYYFKC